MKYKHEINFLFGSFDVPSIKKCSIEKHQKLEADLDEVVSVAWSNIDDLNHLSVGYLHANILTPEQKESIRKIVNNLFK